MDMQQTRSTFEQVYLQYIKPVYFVAYGILGNKEDAEDVAFGGLQKIPTGSQKPSGIVERRCIQ